MHIGNDILVWNYIAKRFLKRTSLDVRLATSFPYWHWTRTLPIRGDWSWQNATYESHRPCTVRMSFVYRIKFKEGWFAMPLYWPQKAKCFDCRECISDTANRRGSRVVRRSMYNLPGRFQFKVLPVWVWRQWRRKNDISIAIWTLQIFANAVIFEKFAEPVPTSDKQNYVDN